MTFKDYWKEKAAKRRKSWVAKAQRFAKHHSVLEDIRKEVYLPLDFAPGFDFDDYKRAHYTKSNPIVQWQQMEFCFSESGLCAALTAEGADMDGFKMEVSRLSIKGKEAPQPDNEWEAYPYMLPNKGLDYENKYHAWLRRIYEICSDVEEVRLTYRQVTMTIRRYSTEGVPFGYYELNPCEQLTKATMLLQETDFHTLNTATLLMEAAAEWELRQEELNYHAKKLKIRTMEAITIDSIEFELWDEKKLQKKIPEYIGKAYTPDKIIEQVIRPWKSAVKKYFEAVSEREKQVKGGKVASSCYRYALESYIKNEIRPFFDSEGLQDARIWKPEEKSTDIYMEYHGHLVRHDVNNMMFYPNAHYEMCGIPIPESTSLVAITDYLKMMPSLSQKVDETTVKALHIYDRLMRQNEEYRSSVEFLEALAAQYAGKPVGKMMKYIQWYFRCFNRNNLLIPSIKIINDTAFSIVRKDVRPVVINGKLTFNCEDEVLERWLDKDCHHVYAGDPITTDVQTWTETHRSPEGFSKTWSWSVRDFLAPNFKYGAYPFLSIDFIEQKL